MEIFNYYRDYGIRYKSFGGNTTVEYLGEPLTVFMGLGQIEGKKKAEEFIDNIYRSISTKE